MPTPEAVPASVSVTATNFRKQFKTLLTYAEKGGMVFVTKHGKVSVMVTGPKAQKVDSIPPVSFPTDANGSPVEAE